MASWRRKRTPQKESEYTEQIAYELYQNRQRLGRSGDAQNDWETARKIVRSRLRTTLFATNRALIKLEKKVWEPTGGLLKRSAFFDVVDRCSPALEAIGVLLIPLVLYLATQAYEEQREAQEIERLQQETVQNYIAQLSEIFLNVEGDLRSEENERIRTIATAATITLLRDPNLDGQRKGQVIEFLGQMSLVQQEVIYGPLRPQDRGSIINLSFADLSGADLSGAELIGADLSNADLRGAEFNKADLSGADLSFADLSGADLFIVDLTFADLSAANLSGANLTFAELSGAELIGAELSGAELIGTNLSVVNLNGANLSGADIVNVDLSGADLSVADLSFANLSYAALANADLSYADLRNIKWDENTIWPPPEQVAKAENIPEELKQQLGIK